MRHTYDPIRDSEYLHVIEGLAVVSTENLDNRVFVDWGTDPSGDVVVGIEIHRTGQPTVEVLGNGATDGRA